MRPFSAPPPGPPLPGARNLRAEAQVLQLRSRRMDGRVLRKTTDTTGTRDHAHYSLNLEKQHTLKTPERIPKSPSPLVEQPPLVLP